MLVSDTVNVNLPFDLPRFLSKCRLAPKGDGVGSERIDEDS